MFSTNRRPPPEPKFSVLHINVRSLKGHLNELEALVYSLESPPILCLSETWLTENDDNKCYLIDGYNKFATCNRKMIQIRKDFKLIKQISTTLEECILVVIEKDNYQFKVAVIYNPPRINKLRFIDTFENFLEENYSPSTPFIICGDINIDISKINQLSNNYMNCIFANGFELGDTKATRVTQTSNTCLDHFIYQNLNEAYQHTLEYQNFSDHFPVLLQWTPPSLKNEKTRLFVTLILSKIKINPIST